MRSDRSRLRGKTLVTFNSGGTANTPVGANVNTSYLGARPAAYSTLYARWRVNRLIVKIITASASAGGVAILGFLDDTVTSSDVPTSATGVLNLRCSASIPVTSSTGTSNAVSTYNEYEWQPLRSSPKWFYTTLEGSSSDPRLEVPCSVWVASPTEQVILQCEIDYDISYEGAVDILSS